VVLWKNPIISCTEQFGRQCRRRTKLSTVPLKIYQRGILSRSWCLLERLGTTRRNTATILGLAFNRKKMKELCPLEQIFGPFIYHSEHIFVLPERVKCTGQLGIFTVTSDVTARILALTGVQEFLHGLKEKYGDRSVNVNQPSYGPTNSSGCIKKH